MAETLRGASVGYCGCGAGAYGARYVARTKLTSARAAAGTVEWVGAPADLAGEGVARACLTSSSLYLTVHTEDMHAKSASHAQTLYLPHGTRAMLPAARGEVARRRAGWCAPAPAGGSELWRMARARA